MLLSPNRIHLRVLNGSQKKAAIISLFSINTCLVLKLFDATSFGFVYI